MVDVCKAVPCQYPGFDPGGPLGASIDPHAAELGGRWLKALSGDRRAQAVLTAKGIGLRRAAEEGIDSAGGFLTPTLYDNEILRLAIRCRESYLRCPADQERRHHAGAARRRHGCLLDAGREFHPRKQHVLGSAHLKSEEDFDAREISQ